MQHAIGPTVADLASYDDVLVTDPAQLQKLLFQIAAVIAYAAALGRLIYLTPVGEMVEAFPSISDGFLALLGVSTGVALVNRAIPRQ